MYIHETPALYTILKEYSLLILTYNSFIQVAPTVLPKHIAFMIQNFKYKHNPENM
jgi:hypothetical protein